MRRRLLFAVGAALSPATRLLAIAKRDGFMPQNGRSSDKPNPKAPAALSQFAFLIGEWRFNAKFKSPQGEWQTFRGTWVGR
jgi:hypothetical protein